MEFVDGELPEPEEVAVKKHLDICDRCYPRYDFQRAYVEFTRQVQDRQRTPPAVRRRLFRAILEQEDRSGGFDDGSPAGPNMEDNHDAR
jgi:anti-sigma factor RsiW